MCYEVQVKTVEKRHIAAVQGRANRENLVEVAFTLSRQVWDYLRAHPEISSTGINIWVYWDDGTGLFLTDEGVPVEPGAEVEEPFFSDGTIVCSHTPAGNVAMVEHVGPYDGIGEAHRAICEWCMENGKELAGPNWEVYGHWCEDPTQLRTEIYYLLS